MPDSTRALVYLIGRVLGFVPAEEVYLCALCSDLATERHQVKISPGFEQGIAFCAAHGAQCDSPHDRAALGSCTIHTLPAPSEAYRAAHRFWRLHS